MTKTAIWWQGARPFSLTVSIIPPVLGGILAAIDQPSLKFNWFYFILALLGCVIAHIGSNLISDYYDYRKRVDREGTFGSSGVLVEKLLTPKQVLRGAWIAFGISGLIGLYFLLTIPNSMTLLWIIAIGAIFAVFYTAGPIQFKYHALGDIAVFVSFGSAMTLGAYFVQTSQLSWSPVLYALPLALLVDAVLHSNNLRDIENDKKVKITTLAMAIGESGSKKMYYFLVFGAYILTVLLVLLAGMPAVTLVTILSLPLAIKVAKIVHNKDKIDPKQFVMIDAATAQLHSAYGVLFIVALLVQHFIVA